jgi:hypothetical protein
MKSFSQFLHESYLSEGVAPGERSARSRKPSKSVEQLKAEIDARDEARAAARAQRGPTGAAARPDLQFKSNKVQSPARGGDIVPYSAPPKPTAPTQKAPSKPETIVKATTSTPTVSQQSSSSSLTQPQKPVEVRDVTNNRRAAADLKARRAAAGTGPSGKAIITPPSSSGGKPPSGARPSTTYRNVGGGKETVKASTPQAQPQRSTTSSGRREITPEMEAEIRKIRADRKVARAAAYDAKNSSSALAKRQSSSLTNTGKSTSSAIVPAPAGKPPVGAKPSRFGRIAGPASAVLDTALSTADERAKGSGWARSLAKGATVAAGGLLGGTAGAIGGGGLLSAATGTAGAMAGGAAAEKAFDTVAGANAKERKAMATANRQRQAGSSLKGIGGTTSFDTKKNTMTTGTGAQRKTVGLAKTGVVQRGGQSVAGHLAYKGGKAVYKAGPSAQSLAKTSSNPLERIGRSLFAGAYKKSDAANAAKKLATARANDAARNKALGVKSKPAG